MSLAFCLILIFATCVLRAQILPPPRVVFGNIPPSLRTVLNNAARRNPTAQPTPQPTDAPVGNVWGSGVVTPPTRPTPQPTRVPTAPLAAGSGNFPPSSAGQKPTAPPTRTPNARAPTTPLGEQNKFPPTSGRGAGGVDAPTPDVALQATGQPSRPPTPKQYHFEEPVAGGGGETDAPTAAPTRMPSSAPGRANNVQFAPSAAPDQPSAAPTPLVPLGAPIATQPPTAQAADGVPDPRAPTIPTPTDNITGGLSQPSDSNLPQPGVGEMSGLGNNRPSSSGPTPTLPGNLNSDNQPGPSDTGSQIGGGDNDIRGNPTPPGQQQQQQPFTMRPRGPIAVMVRQSAGGIFRTPQIKTDGTLNTNQLDAEVKEPSAEPTEDAGLQNQKRGLSGGAIAGIVIGALVGVAALAAIGAFAISALTSSPPSAPTAFSDEEVYYQLV